MSSAERSPWRLRSLVPFALLLSSCKFEALPPVEADASGGDAPVGHTVTVTVDGSLWENASLQLALEAPGYETEIMEVTRTGAYTFEARLQQGTAYAIRVEGQPAHHTCTPLDNIGEISDADATSPHVSCVDEIDFRIASLPYLGSQPDTALAETNHDLSVIQQEIRISPTTRVANTTFRLLPSGDTMVQSTANETVTFGAVPLGTGETVVAVEASVEGMTRRHSLRITRGRIPSFAGAFPFGRVAGDEACQALSRWPQTGSAGGPQAFLAIGSPGATVAGFSGAGRVTGALEVVSPVAAADTRFGSSVALQDGLALVGAPGDDQGGADAGAVYVFSQGIGWSSVRIEASDHAAGARFGASVAVDQNIAVVGAPGANGHGATYVFERTGGVWTERQTLVPAGATPGDDFGASVAVVGEVLVVAAPGDDSDASGVGTSIVTNDARPNSGALFVYRRVVDTWVLHQYVKAPAPQVGAEFGRALALEQDPDSPRSALVVGAPGAGTNQEGRGYVLGRNGNDVELVSTLDVPSSGAAGARHGTSVTITGDLAALGGPGSAGGSVALFQKAPVWSFKTMLMWSGTDVRAGTAVLLTRGQLIACAPGLDDTGNARLDAGGYVYAN